MRIVKDIPDIPEEVERLPDNSTPTDDKKRLFLKFLGVAGLGFVGSLLLPKRADAYVFGSTPTSSVVGVKNESDVRINPATVESVQALAIGQGITKVSASLAASGNVLVPTAGKKLRIYSIRFSLDANLDAVSFRFVVAGGGVGTDFEKYLTPKTGGLYGSNNNPNYVEGEIDKPLYAVITGAGNIQVNVDYLEV